MSAESRVATASRLSVWFGVGGVYLFVLALLILGRCMSSDFWTAENLVQVVRDVSILGIVATGLAFITYSGHYIDISIPTIMAVAGIVSVAMLPYGFWFAVPVGLAAGTLLGAINGFAVGYLRLNPILWTLAALALADGITRWAYGGKWIYADTATSSGALFSGLYRAEGPAGIPAMVLLFLVVALAGHVLMRHTGYGRQLKLTGSAYETARLTGVPVRRTVMLAFLISGFAAALGGILKTSLNTYGDVEIGLTYEFQAITAVVIGGIPMAGGRGSMAGVIGGVLVMGLLGRILPLLPGIGQDEQFIIRGVIFIAVVGISQLALRRGGRDDQ